MTGHPCTKSSYLMQSTGEIGKSISKGVAWASNTPKHTGLYGSGLLSLPISSLVEEYKCARAKLEITLTESQVSTIISVAPT